MGLFGGDSSTTGFTQIKTSAVDNRSVADADAVAVGTVGKNAAFAADGANAGHFGSLNNSTVVFQSSDKDIFSRALDTVDAIAGEGMAAILKTATDLMGQSSDAALAAVTAINTAGNDKAGALDQKTLLILGALVLGAVYFMARGK
jgi:hypothetical protein